MRNLRPDLYGLNHPYLYRVDVVRDTNSDYVANLDDDIVFVGYYTTNPDVLLSRFLAFTKAELLADDPHLVENGNAYVQVYLVDRIRSEQYLIYDSSQNYKGSRGFSQEIIENLRKEIDLLWCFLTSPSKDIVVVKDNGKDYPYIISQWNADYVDPYFLKPLSADDWELRPLDFKQALRLSKEENRSNKLGFFRMYRPYESSQPNIEDAA